MEGSVVMLILGSCTKKGNTAVNENDACRKRIIWTKHMGILMQNTCVRTVARGSVKQANVKRSLYMS